jgi:hypothetical protein
MKQLTIRGVADDLHRELRIKADQNNMSINRYVLTIIKEAVGFTKHGTLHDVEFNDLDNLAGTWSEEDFQEFKELLDGQRTIDPELWQ